MTAADSGLLDYYRNVEPEIGYDGKPFWDCVMCGNCWPTPEQAAACDHGGTP